MEKFAYTLMLVTSIVGCRQYPPPGDIAGELETEAQRLIEANEIWSRGNSCVISVYTAAAESTSRTTNQLRSLY